MENQHARCNHPQSLTRRDLLTLGAAGLAGWALAPYARALSGSPPARRMNVLFISVDDLNPSLGCFGNPDVQTPNMDGLAARGVRFTRAYSQWPSCLPSRASFLSGWYPAKTGVHDFSPASRDGALKDVTYLPQHFKNNGYYTAREDKIFHIGKDDPASWTLSEEPWKDPESGRFKPIWTGIELKTLGLEPHVLTGGQYEVKGEKGLYSVMDVEDDALFDGRTAARGVELLEQFKRDGTAFFLALGFRRPHQPWTVPKKYFDLYPPDKITLAPGSTPAGQNEQVRREMTAHYYASTTFIDVQIGKVIDALDRLGLRGNTIVVLFGDQGYCLGERDNHYGKGTLWERSYHVPLIIDVPGTKNAGAACGQPVGLIDMYPTLNALCGLPAPASGTQGDSLVPLLESPKAAGRGYTISFNSEGKGKATLSRTIRTAQYRYAEKSDGTPVELIDYDTDPYERNNLVDDPAHAQVRAGLQKQLRSAVAAQL
ncbi:sulfatase [bacterium]|nr:sulfatase [bacterium]